MAKEVNYKKIIKELNKAYSSNKMIEYQMLENKLVKYIVVKWIPDYIAQIVQGIFSDVPATTDITTLKPKISLSIKYNLERLFNEGYDEFAYGDITNVFINPAFMKHYKSFILQVLLASHNKFVDIVNKQTGSNYSYSELTDKEIFSNPEYAEIDFIIDNDKKIVEVGDLYVYHTIETLLS